MNTERRNDKGEIFDTRSWQQDSRFAVDTMGAWAKRYANRKCHAITKSSKANYTAAGQETRRRYRQQGERFIFPTHIPYPEKKLSPAAYFR